MCQKEGAFAHVIVICDNNNNPVHVLKDKGGLWWEWNRNEIINTSTRVEHSLILIMITVT